MNDGLQNNERDKIVALCKAIIPNASIWLYGSRARGDYSHNSDIDLALKAETPIGYLQIAELKRVLEASNTPHSFDIVDINSLSDKNFKEYIEKEMVLWKK